MQVIGQKESLCIVGPALGNLMAREKGQAILEQQFKTRGDGPINRVFCGKTTWWDTDQQINK